MAVSSADLLDALRPALVDLSEDLLERAKDLRVNAGLQAVWRREKDAQRTADTFEVWARERVKQIAAAWVLSLVFVRTLEDRNLIDRRRIAGDGAGDSEELFFRLAPHLTQRDYLLTIFRELEHLEGARHIFGPRHNPLWLLGPSGEAAARLLEAFRATDEVGSIRLDFSGTDTRFLGDLYQDLDDESRVRYALLQTPEFVEEFILDETLDPAIRQYGVENIRMIDPACGSGHFLLGAYRRLLKSWREIEPATDLRELAGRVLEQVNGIDLNPYAVAIARFRMTLAYLEAAGHVRLKESPPLKLKIATADSLVRQRRFAAFDHESGGSDAFVLEDTDLAAEILRDEIYHVVVGNPPYINVKDKALRDLYRSNYVSCYRSYQLVAPFLERFFQLALNPREAATGGYVGVIVGNGFMKREFGKKLVEEVLSKQQLTHLVDTSGAYIPGHGTPTVILSGRRWSNPKRPPQTSVLAVMGKRGEPSTPDDPAHGRVWSSIRDHHRKIGYEDDYISVDEVDSSKFSAHPWTLSGGGARGLFDLLNASTNRTLTELTEDSGAVALTRCDEAFVYPPSAPNTLHRGDLTWRPYTAGEDIRDWSISKGNCVLWPYDTDLEGHESQSELLRVLWPSKSILLKRVAFGKTQMERGLKWYQYSMLFGDRLKAKRKVVFADISTHNHFCLGGEASVFNSHAPVIRLPEDATEDDHLALLGYLNSSVACFWMKQVSFCRGSTVDQRGARQTTIPFEDFWEHDGAKVRHFPLPDSKQPLQYARCLDQLASEASKCTPFAVAQGCAPTRDALDTARAKWESFRRVMIAAQEELDWVCYRAYGLDVPEGQISPEDLPGLDLGERPFEILLARNAEHDAIAAEWFRRHRSEPRTSIPDRLDEGYQSLVRRRIACIQSDREIALIEKPEFKRRWASASWEEQEKAALAFWILGLLEERIRTRGGTSCSIKDLAMELQHDSSLMPVVELYVGDPNPNLEQVIGDLIIEDSVPYLAAWRHTDSGLEKRSAWETIWELQRREDAGETVEVPVPPKYSQTDFRSGVFWRHRGKLDVPKERFISYPGAETEGEGSLVVGWAGWDHLEQAKALAELYNHRKREEGWPVEKLVPLLAGLLELVPWLKQWHNEPDAAFGGARVGDTYEAFVAAEAASFRLSLDDLRAWGPRSEAPGRPRGASSGQPGSHRVRTPAIDRDQLLVRVNELDEGDGAEQRVLAERLGVSVAAVARVAGALVREGVLEVTGRRPKRFRCSAPGASGESA